MVRAGANFTRQICDKAQRCATPGGLRFGFGGSTNKPDNGIEAKERRPAPARGSILVYSDRVIQTIYEAVGDRDGKLRLAAARGRG